MNDVERVARDRRILAAMDELSRGGTLTPEQRERHEYVLMRIDQAGGIGRPIFRSGITGTRGETADGMRLTGLEGVARQWLEKILADHGRTID